MVGYRGGKEWRRRDLEREGGRGEDRKKERKGKGWGDRKIVGRTEREEGCGKREGRREVALKAAEKSE